MKRFFRTLFAFYGVVVFSCWVIFSFLLMLFWTLLFGKKRDKQLFRIFFKKFPKYIAATLFLKTENIYHGTYNFNQSYIVVSNHTSAIDIVLNPVAAPKPILFKFLSKAELGKIPVFGTIMQRFTVLVDRKNATSRKESYKKMQENLENGYSILIYPEGTRNRTEALIKKMYDGAFRLAIRCKKPIVVCTLIHANKLNAPEYRFDLAPGNIQTHWEAPIDTSGFTIEDLPHLKEIVRQKMVGRLRVVSDKL